MELSSNPYQNSKNRRKLIQQNLKILQQVEQIKIEIDKWYYEQSLRDSSEADEKIKPILDQIAEQEKLIKKLKKKIQMFKLERAKDNVEYIVHEEDELKIMKQKEQKLIDEKNIYLNKRVDKNWHLQKDVPYQTYEKDFLGNLNEVVRYNREQGAKITEIEREIRKYHLIKKGKDSPVEKPLSPELIIEIERQIAEKVDKRKEMQSQWKPHFDKMDNQYAGLIYQQSKKKEELAELQKQENIWITRISPLRQAEVVLTDKNRISSVKVSTKLRQKIIDYIQMEEEKKSKKVNTEQLKYQFTDLNATDQKEQDTKEGAKVNAPPPLPGQKKKEQKIMETYHNDKNITKKVEKAGAKEKKIIKANQTVNTEVTIPSKKAKGDKLSKEELSPRMAAKRPFEIVTSQQRQARLWDQKQQIEPPIRESVKSTPRALSLGGNQILQLKEVAIETQVANWEAE